MLSVAHSATQNEFMLLEKMEMPSALLTIREKEGGKKNPNTQQRGGGRIFFVLLVLYFYTLGATVKRPMASPEVTRGQGVRADATFCLGWLGDDTTTVLQMVRAMKKSMMSARSEGSWDTGWLWKRMKSI